MLFQSGVGWDGTFLGPSFLLAHQTSVCLLEDSFSMFRDIARLVRDQVTTESGEEELVIWRKTKGFSEAVPLGGLNKVKHGLLAMSGTACAHAVHS